MLASSGGLTSALIVSACFVLFGNLIAGLFFFKGIPEDYGWVAIGAENIAKDSTDGAPAELPGLTKAEAFKKSYFWVFLLAMSVLNFAYGLCSAQPLGIHSVCWLQRGSGSNRHLRLVMG